MTKFFGIEFDDDELRKLLHTAPRCKWRCPFCGRRCGGIVGHKGNHQCAEHSSIPVSQWCR